MNSLPKNVAYAIRMLSFHTRLVKKYTSIINRYVTKCESNSKKHIDKIESELYQEECNLTIYDFIGKE